MITGGSGRHAGQPVAQTGPELGQARGALVLLHGRGADAPGMLRLGSALVGPDIACLAPAAAGHVWYPRRFIEPTDSNEPDLTSALSVVAALIAAIEAAGVPASRLGLCGFSQGACLALEHARRHGGVGAVLGFSGGVIGQTAGDPGPPAPGLPLLLGCSEHDPHIPLARVHETAALFRTMGAEVDVRIAPGAGHEVTAGEIAAGHALLARIHADRSDAH